MTKSTTPNKPNKSNYFFCYNKTVSDFMYSKGVHYITVAMDVRSQKIFSLFEVTPEFQSAMEEYRLSKK